MRKAVVLFLLVCLLGLSLYHPKKDVGTIIEANLNRIVTNQEVAASSNPYDYIKGNPQAYRNIVNTGRQGLIYLSDQLSANSQHGLKEWIMAKACEDIQKADSEG